MYKVHLLIYKCVSLDARSVVHRSNAFTKIVRASVDAIIPYQNVGQVLLKTYDKKYEQIIRDEKIKMYDKELIKKKEIIENTKDLT